MNNLSPRSPPLRKRKHKAQNDDLEDVYMHRLALLDARDRGADLQDTAKRMKLDEDSAVSGEGEDIDEDDWKSDHEGSGSDDQRSDQSLGNQAISHETMDAATKVAEIEKSARTVFLGNVSTQAITSKAAKKTLLRHLLSFLPSLVTDEPELKAPTVESIRFRSTAFSATGIPKKAAYAKKELMDATAKSTNAYVVYSTVSAARDAVKHLNGTMVLDRHLRADSVAHPSQIDPRRCVFVGNLGFVDDDRNLRAVENEYRNGGKLRSKPAGDVEEGLWRHFAEAGTIESVRVVRDSKTRVGKGFAYVQYVVSRTRHGGPHDPLTVPRTPTPSRPPFCITIRDFHLYYRGNYEFPGPGG
ncbi:MAG: Nucleolar protein 12 [Phylliscum demangeonii]|nr:MAG: Nucleolar protein 12 [Phylliscum demangeonii]